MKSLMKFSTAMLMSILAVFSASQVMGTNLSGAQTLGCATGLSFGYSVVSNVTGMHSNKQYQLNAVVLEEMFTGELVNKLRTIKNWMSAVQNKDQYVGNNVIHLNDIGADPTVLINNTVYPIAANPRTDNDIPLSLNKYDTENTKITDDELYALTYDKTGSVVTQHQEALSEKIDNHVLWSLCPAADDAANAAFVIRTTGPTVGTRKRLIRADIFRLSTLMSNKGVALEGRHIVLSPEHLEDLLIEDTNLQNQLTDQGGGKAAAKIGGFNIWFSSYSNMFSSAGAKKAFGSAPAGTDRNASTVIYTPRTWKAYGSTSMYYSEAKSNPELRESMVGFRQYAAGGVIKKEGSGAIVSEVV